jgi:diamine N-acetyltransferase
MTIQLREVTRATVTAVCKLDAGDGGRQVAPNAVSIAQAHFQGEAWYCAAYDDEALVGKGYGRAVVEALVEHVRTRPGARRLLVSHVKGAEKLSVFYRSLGFEYTGVESEGEVVMERTL